MSDIRAIYTTESTPNESPQSPLPPPRIEVPEIGDVRITLVWQHAPACQMLDPDLEGWSERRCSSRSCGYRKLVEVKTGEDERGAPIWQRVGRSKRRREIVLRSLLDYAALPYTTGWRGETND